MVGTPCWAASVTARPQPSLRDGSTCTQLRCSTSCLVDVVDVAVEGHRVGDAEQPGVVDEAVSPPAAADDVEVQAGNPRPQLGDGVERVLDLLVRHQPAEHRHARMLRARQLERLARAPRRVRCAPRRSARRRRRGRRGPAPTAGTP